jgi:hypothetical protein
MPSENLQSGASGAVPAAVRVPAQTAWPVVLAFGITLLFCGLLTNIALTILGAVLAVPAAIGWFCDVFPEEKHEYVPVLEVPVEITTRRLRVTQLEVAPETHRPLLPVETYPVSAGVKGGLAGAVAMAGLACLYGLISQGSIWYPINLLAATVNVHSLEMGLETLKAFHLGTFLIAIVIHVVVSVLVGLLYGAMLPMVSRHPIFLGGVVAPVLWSGVVRSLLDLLNPLLGRRINWWWFIASQVGFGIVAGLVVIRQERVRVKQTIPWTRRIGRSTAAGSEQNGEGHRG